MKTDYKIGLLGYFRAFVMFVLLASNYGCRSKQAAQQTKENINIEQITESTSRSTEKTNSETSLFDRSVSEWQRLIEKDFEFLFTQYDSDKPIDTLTGKPPIAAELRGTLRQKTNETANKQNDVEQSANLSFEAENLNSDNANLSFDSKNLTKSESKTDTRPIQGVEWIYIIGVFVIICSIILWWR